MNDKIEIYFDENLRDVAKDPLALKIFVNELIKELDEKSEPENQVKLLGELGVYNRILLNFDLAKKYLLQAINIVLKNELDSKYEIQQQIRLAHVYQWEREFLKSTQLFEQIIELCRTNKEVSIYLDFALQHAGKNFFDQGKIQLALQLFQEAQKIRLLKNSPTDQLDSTSLAIKKCNELLNLNRFEIFKEIKIGGISKEKLLQRLSDAGIQFNQYADVLFDHPHFNPSEEVENIKLVKVSLMELGLSDKCSWDEFSNRVSILGLKLCPLYLGAFLRLEYLDQPSGLYLTIASIKLEANEVFPNGLYLRNFENVLWLRGYKADGFDGWPGVNEFIFTI